MIKRRDLPDIRKHLEEPEITMLIGPRQSGKTTIIEILRNELMEQGKKTLYLNVDIDSDAVFFTSQENLVRRIVAEFGEESGYVFIDEIQRKENAGLFLKGIYDRKLPYKFIVTGSGSIELKENISESLAGRKRIFEITTLTFEEFANYRTGYRYEDRLKEYLKIDTSAARSLLLEYLNFGGYPKVVLAPGAEEKFRSIEEIYKSYLLKDITDLLGLTKPDQFTNLVKVLSHQMGNIISYAGLSSSLDLTEESVKKYLWYLENTYILDVIKPFYKNKVKEIIKSPVVYFHDLGLRNYASDELGRVEFMNSIGFLFQNFVYLQLKHKIRHSSSIINFWRTKDGAEVDFIIDGLNITPYEVKYRSIQDLEVGKSLRSFITKYSPKDAYVINLSTEKTAVIDNTNLSIISWIDLI